MPSLPLLSLLEQHLLGLEAHSELNRFAELDRSICTDSVAGEKDQTLNQLLVEMDGFGDAENVIVIAASNLLEKLDPALLRPGRFDRRTLLSPPDINGREDVLKAHTNNEKLSDDVDLRLIAQRTSGLSGAELANIANEAAICAGR